MIEVFVEKDGAYVVSPKYDKVEVLIPSDYFKNNLAVPMGEKIHTLGIINMVAYQGTKEFVLQLSLPIKLQLNIYGELVPTTFDVNGELVDFMSTTINKGDIFIESVKHIQSLFNSIEFLDWFNGAKISDSVPYNDVTNMFLEASSMNGIGLGVPQVLLDIMLSEMCRDKDDIATPYRLRINKTGKDDNSYKFIPIKEIPRTSSVLAALAFEDITKANRAGIIQTETGQQQRLSPIEDLLKI